MEVDGDELCMIDCGIKNLQDVSLRPQLRVVNLHCNLITHIENLHPLHFLRHLDLSSNRIYKIAGLDTLVSLRTLNLACNLIETVEGLHHLRSLVKLNLSYNEINNVSGFLAVRGKEYKLSQVELQGNRIHSVQHICECLGECYNLRQLDLTLNPLCQDPGFADRVWTSLPQLRVLDGRDSSGSPVRADNVLADIPGLEQYMEFLFSSSSSDVNPLTVATPKIDQALDMFRQRGATTPEPSTDIDSSHMASGSSTSHTTPKNNLGSPAEGVDLNEAKISSKSSMASRDIAKRDIDHTDESETNSSPRAGGATSKTRIHSQRRTAGASRNKKTQQQNKQFSSQGQTSRSDTRHADRVVNPQKPQKFVLTPTKEKSTQHVLAPEARPTAIATDEQGREEVRSTYVCLMQELERERERRWKAEQAVKKLLDQLQELQSKAQDGQDIQDMAMHATTRLKQALTNEREAKARLQDDFHATKVEAASLAQQLEASKQAQNDQQRALKALQDTASKREVEQTQQRIHESKRTQEAQMRAAATHRELELVRNNETMLRGQVQQLQELLANREQEHRTEMEGRFGLDSREMKEAIAREVSRKEEFHRQQLKLQQDEVDALSQKYSELEDEFRMALQIEAQRFKEVQEAFQHTSAEAAQSKQALIAAQRKDEQSSKLLTELSAMVKEQKGRITEMSKSKHEQQVEMKERIQNLEAHVEEAKKRMVQLEMLKQEKKKMESTLLAQESVIEGLRAERKLWSQELAQQGASLAQDRGRLDAKIEALKTENASLQRQLQRELDSLKIKTKMLDDQTETIRKLKEGLMERDEDLKKAREEVLKVQQDFEAQLDAEMTANQDLQERLDRTRDRKEELKEEKTHLEEQLAESRKAHSVLNAKWKEKSNLIGQLEERVRQMKETWETKERKLTEEHDKAVHAQSVAIEKMRSLDDSFRKQLADIEAGHQVALQRLAQEKQKEIDQAHFRVAEVEEELRELLRENQTNKRAMEERVKKLTKAFSDLQQDMA